MTQTGRHLTLPPLASLAVALPSYGNIRTHRSGRFAPKQWVLLPTLLASTQE